MVKHYHTYTCSICLHRIIYIYTHTYRYLLLVHTTYTCIYIYTYACGSNKTRTPCNDPFPADLSRGVARLGRCRDFGCGGAFVQDFSDPWGPQIGMSIVSHLIFGVPNFDPYLYIYIYIHIFIYSASSR